MAKFATLSDAELDLVAGGGGIRINVQIGNGGSGGTAVSGVAISNGNKNRGISIGYICVDSGNASADGGKGGNLTIG